MEEALFTSKLYPHRTHPEFEQFIQSYIRESYDFSPYKEQLGEKMLDLLNAMQAQNPKDRPSTEECIVQLQQTLSTCPTSDMRSSV